MNRIKELRTRNGMTQAELAEIIGINSVTLARYESGDRNPKIDKLEKMAEIFNVSVDYLTGKTDDNYSSFDNIDFSELKDSIYNFALNNSLNTIYSASSENKKLNSIFLYFLGLTSDVIQENNPGKLENYLSIMEALVSPTGIIPHAFSEKNDTMASKKAGDDYTDASMDVVLDNFFKRKTILNNAIDKFFLDEFNKRYNSEKD